MNSIIEFISVFIKKNSKNQIIILLLLLNGSLAFLSYKLYNGDIDLYNSKSSSLIEKYELREESIREENDAKISNILRDQNSQKIRSANDCDSLLRTTLDRQLVNYNRLYKKVSDLELKLYEANIKLSELETRANK